MRITFLLPTVVLSGGIRVVAIYAKWLTDRGHEVFLISPPGPTPSLIQKASSFIKGRGWPTTPKPQASHLDGLGLNHRVLNRYRAVVDGDVPDADVVVATWWETAEWVASLSRSKGKKVYFVQGHEIFDFLPVDRCKATYKLPLHKIVVSRWLAEIMSNEYGDDHLDLVPNAVDHEQFHAAARGKQRTPTVGFLYHEASFKGMDMVLLAISKLRQTFPDLKAICFGSHQPSGRFNLEPYIEFHLLPPQDQLRKLYADCDVWLAASRSEGFNLTAMEAMACRVPVVSTRVGWPAEAIDTGRNGVLIDVDDLVGLVNGAKWVLGLDDALWRNISESAYQSVLENTWERSSYLFEQALMSI